ncbi:hypothetical protein [Methylocystis sp.]|uniref:hypothetical protein n=1 Tax=Methylocystis sp. TaxID=1911079 RepID=UPI0025DC85F9|nr:hypothetical protein [Methylocystis sp.]
MTSQVLFNQFAYVDRLKTGGFSDDQARASAEALAGALSETVATSSQLSAVETKLGGEIAAVEAKLGAQIAAVEAKLGAQIAAVEAKLGAQIAAVETKLVTVGTNLDAKINTTAATLRAEIEKSKSSLLIWLIGLIVGSTITISGVILAALRAFGKVP